jgi:hypothetical protein
VLGNLAKESVDMLHRAEKITIARAKVVKKHEIHSFSSKKQRFSVAKTPFVGILPYLCHPKRAKNVWKN